MWRNSGRCTQRWAAYFCTGTTRLFCRTWLGLPVWRSRWRPKTPPRLFWILRSDLCSISKHVIDLSLHCVPVSLIKQILWFHDYITGDVCLQRMGMCLFGVMESWEKGLICLNPRPQRRCRRHFSGNPNSTRRWRCPTSAVASTTLQPLQVRLSM